MCVFGVYVCLYHLSVVSMPSALHVEVYKYGCGLYCESLTTHSVPKWGIPGGQYFLHVVYIGVSQPPGCGINHTGLREVLLEFVIFHE